MPRFAANLSMLFTERPFMDRFAAAAGAGFRGVEILFPYEHDAGRIRNALEEHGLALALLNAPAGDWAAGERGLAAVPGPEAESRFEGDLHRILEWSRALRPGVIHVLAGIAQGPAARATYLERLGRLCAFVPEQRFTIEPINDRNMPGYHLASTADARAVIAEVGAPNLRLQLDLYHAQIMEGDLTDRIAALSPLIGHVQVAGVPGRHEPDTGELSFAHLMRVLDGIGYDGWVGAEYRPAGTTEAGLGWFKPWRDREGAAP